MEMCPCRQQRPTLPFVSRSHPLLPKQEHRSNNSPLFFTISSSLLDHSHHTRPFTLGPSIQSLVSLLTPLQATMTLFSSNTTSTLCCRPLGIFLTFCKLSHSFLKLLKIRAPHFNGNEVFHGYVVICDISHPVPLALPLAPNLYLWSNLVLRPLPFFSFCAPSRLVHAGPLLRTLSVSCESKIRFCSPVQTSELQTYISKSCWKFVVEDLNHILNI